MDKPSFVYVTYIATTAERLWEALTSADFTEKYWSHLRIESDWKVGSPVRLLRPDGESTLGGEVLRADPPRVLSYTFKVGGRSCDGEAAPDEPASRVTCEIEPVTGRGERGPVVKLTLTHDGFEPGSEIFKGISSGWPPILAGLKSVLENGTVLFPDKH